MDLVVGPRTLVESGGRLRLHALYYITKQIIPALERVLSLVGADCRWAAGQQGSRGEALPPDECSCHACTVSENRSASDVLPLLRERHVLVAVPREHMSCGS